jgi:hypothetical protein
MPKGFVALRVFIGGIGILNTRSARQISFDWRPLAYGRFSDDPWGGSSRISSESDEEVAFDGMILNPLGELAHIGEANRGLWGDENI